MTLANSQGKIFYGIHFVPGLAQYSPPHENSKRVYLNETTLRQMDPSFAGRPVFVNHVDAVEQSVDLLNREVDGWVIESFFNQADGKHWAKFIITSERGFQAIKNGWRLSNAYFPKAFGAGGIWNGIQYEQEITEGEFEHLAIVENPRYEESVIMTPEQFKAHNEAKAIELKKLSNSKEGVKEMAFKLFKREPVKNELDFAATIVVLPKSNKEMTLEKLVNDHDAILNMHGYANGDHMVKVGDKDEMSVNDLLKKHMELSNEMEEMKKSAEEKKENEGSDDDEDDKKDNESDEDEESKKKDKKDKKENEDSEKARKEDERKENARKAADDVRSAPVRYLNEVRGAIGPDHIELSSDKVARGKARYGSQR